MIFPRDLPNIGADILPRVGTRLHNLMIPSPSSPFLYVVYGCLWNNGRNWVYHVLQISWRRWFVHALVKLVKTLDIVGHFLMNLLFECHKFYEKVSSQSRPKNIDDNCQVGISMCSNGTNEWRSQWVNEWVSKCVNGWTSGSMIVNEWRGESMRNDHFSRNYPFFRNYGSGATDSWFRSYSSGNMFPYFPICRN